MRNSVKKNPACAGFFSYLKREKAKAFVRLFVID
jgi:hypothetical protein